MILCDELQKLVYSDERFRTSLGGIKATNQDEKMKQIGSPSVVLYPLLNMDAVQYVFDVCLKLQRKYKFKCTHAPNFNLHVEGALYYAGGDSTEKAECIEGAKIEKEGTIIPKGMWALATYGKYITENLYEPDMVLFKEQKHLEL